MGTCASKSSYGELVLFQAWKSPGVEGGCNTKQKEPAVSLRAMTSHHSWVRPFATDLHIYYFLIINLRSISNRISVRAITELC